MGRYYAFLRHILEVLFKNGIQVAEIYRAHAFEKHFWDFIREKTAEIGEGKATMSSPVTVTP